MSIVVKTETISFLKDITCGMRFINLWRVFPQTPGVRGVPEKNINNFFVNLLLVPYRILKTHLYISNERIDKSIVKCGCRPLQKFVKRLSSTNNKMHG